LIDENNQWLMYEIKVCRIVLGLTQTQLAQLLGQSLYVVKRIETTGSQPKYRTLNTIKRIFEYLGVSCRIDEEGTTRLKL
jgi:predicted transcriptional regulator